MKENKETIIIILRQTVSISVSIIEDKKRHDNCDVYYKQRGCLNQK